MGELEVSLNGFYETLLNLNIYKHGNILFVLLKFSMHGRMAVQVKKNYDILTLIVKQIVISWRNFKTAKYQEKNTASFIFILIKHKCNIHNETENYYLIIIPAYLPRKKKVLCMRLSGVS